jgi:hypothetical protein
MTRLWLLAACSVPELPGDDSSCDARELEPGELRLRRIPCNDERISYGDGRRGDWLMENAASRFVFRTVGGSLSDVEGSAGGMVDAARPSGIDALVELRPLDFDYMSASAVVSEGRAELRVQGRHFGEDSQIVYSLEENDPVLKIEADVEWLLAPYQGSVIYGRSIEPAHGRYVYAYEAEVEEDLGGALRLSGLRSFAVGEWEEVHGWLEPEAVWAEGESTAEWVEAIPEGTARLPVKDGAYAGWLPKGTLEIRGAEEGCLPGEAQPLDASDPLETGACGSILVRVQDDAGNPIPALLHWEGRNHPIQSGGQRLPLEPRVGEAWIQAGPGHEAQRVFLDSSEHPELSLRLNRAVPEGTLFMPQVIGSPDSSERRGGDALLREAAAKGVALAVISARRTVPPYSVPEAGDGWAPWIQALQGSMSETQGVQAWPWTKNRNLPGFGAAPGHTLPPAELLSFSKKGGRMSMVGTDWAEASDGVHNWAMHPDFIWLGGAEELEAYYGLLGNALPLPPLGPMTWVHGLAGRTAHSTDILMQAMDHNVTAGNGPWLQMEIDGHSTGQPVPASGELLEIRISLTTPEWMPMDRLRLIGPEGVVAEWELSGPAITLEMEVEAVDWILAEATGPAAPPMLEEPAWAITATSWIDP